MWDLVGNPKDQFSHNEAHIIVALFLQLMEVLDQDPVSMRMQLPVKLGTVITAMEGPNSGKLAFV